MSFQDFSLSNIRVLDLGRMMAGPYCTTMLALMGAEVIKIENEKHMDTTRILPPCYEGQAGVNRSFGFNTLNVNKQSLLLDLQHPEGRKLFKELVKQSDVVVDNFSPRVMRSLGLGYDVLRSLRPDVIVVSLSGFGATGPEKDYLSYATVVEALSGITALNGFPGGPPSAGGVPYPDFFMGSYGAFSIIAALVYRDVSGEGQFIDVSQLQATVSLFPEAVLEWEVNQRPSSPRGNTWDGSGVSGCYRCKGNDKWLAIQASTDAEWRALCEVLGEPALADDKRYATVMDRAAHGSDLRAWLQARIEHLDAVDLTHRLQQKGVIASPSCSILDLLHDPHIVARGLVHEVNHPVTKFGLAIHAPWSLSATPSHISTAAPLLGEHTVPILRDLLGIIDKEVQYLAEQRVLA